MTKVEDFIERYRHGYGDISVAVEELVRRVHDAEAENDKHRADLKEWEEEGAPRWIEDREERIAAVEAERDAAQSTIAKVRGVVELLYPDEMTPTAKRHLDRALGSVPSTGEGNDAVQGG